MLVQPAIHFALDYLIQSACRYFELSIGSNKVWGKSVFAIGSSYHLCQLKPTEKKVTNFLVNERTINKRVPVLGCHYRLV